MKLNPKEILFGTGSGKKNPVLLAVTPPRTGERTLLGVENLLQSIAVPEPFSLELAGGADGVTLMARCIDREVVRSQLSAHYPQARIRKVDPADDPLRLDEGEQAWSMTLRADGPEYVPLRTFRDDDLLDPGSDPLIALLGALTALRPGERTVARLMLRSLGPDWSQPHLEKAHKMPGMEPREPAYTFQTKPLQMDGVTMAVLGLGALAALKGYLWVQDGEIWKAALLGHRARPWGWPRAAGRGTAGRRSASGVEDPLLIREKVSRIAFDAEIQVTALLPADTVLMTAPPSCLSRWQPGLPPLRQPRGGAAQGGEGEGRSCPDPDDAAPRQAPGLFGRRSVLGVREVGLPCGTRPERATRRPWWSAPARRGLSPPGPGASAAVRLVGDTTAGKTMPIRFPEDLLRRHHLYVARTRMGKSTLMHHIVAHKMQGEGRGQGRRRHRRNRPPHRSRGRRHAGTGAGVP